MKFYICEKCGNVIAMIEGNNDSIKCCDIKMKELIENEVDASIEKHVPVYEINDDNIEVMVGEDEHPMLDKHYIMFIAQVLNNNIELQKLTSSEKPIAKFKYQKGSKIYALCNIHGLWTNIVE